MNIHYGKGFHVSRT